MTRWHIPSKEDHINCVGDFVSIKNFLQESISSKVFLQQELICVEYTLPEWFLEENKDLICFTSISFSQKLSDKYIKKNINKLDIESLLINAHFSKEIKEEIKLLKEII